MSAQRTISVRLHREMRDALEEMARRNDRTLSGEIRFAVKRYLRQKGAIR